MKSIESQRNHNTHSLPFVSDVFLCEYVCVCVSQNGTSFTSLCNFQTHIEPCCILANVQHTNITPFIQCKQTVCTQFVYMRFGKECTHFQMHTHTHIHWTTNTKWTNTEVIVSICQDAVYDIHYKTDIDAAENITISLPKNRGNSIDPSQLERQHSLSLKRWDENNAHDL